MGGVWKEDELKKVAELGKKYDKWIISDEIHCDLTRIGVTHISLLKAAPEYRDRIIVCTAPSKTFNLAGMQFSNIIIPNKDYQKCWLNMIDEQFSMAICSPLGLTAVVAAYNEGEEWLDQVRAYIDGNIQYIQDFVKKYLPDVDTTACEGTYLVWLDMRKYTTDRKKLEQVMLDRAKVILDEGYIFGDEGVGFERINAAPPRSVIEACMNRIKVGLESLRG